MWTAEGPVYVCAPSANSRPPAELAPYRESGCRSHGNDKRGQQDVCQVTLNRLQPPSVAEERQQHTVAAREHLYAALPPQPVPALDIRTTGQGVPQLVERDRRVELMGHPVLGDLELHGTDRCQHRRLVTS